MKFCELTDKQKVAALDEHRYINMDDQWDDELIENFTNKMSEAGFKCINVFADASFCQGSGASFVCDHIDVIAVLKHYKKLTAFSRIRSVLDNEEILVTIFRNSSQYNHEMTMECVIDSNNIFTKKQMQDCIDLREFILETARNECRKFHSEYENHALDLTSDENVKETIEINDFDFVVKNKASTYIDM